MAITIKSNEEIEAMRISGRILGQTLSEVCKHAKPGVSTLELDTLAEEIILSLGAKPGFKGYNGFPNTICAAVDEEIVHGIPRADKILKEGDLFTVDCGVIYKGMNTDAARSIAIGKTSKEKERLMKTAHHALKAAINLAKPGTKVNELGAKIEEIVEEAGYKVIYDLTGHGIGKTLHEDPVVANHYDPKWNMALKPGMTIAIEPIFAVSTHTMKLAKDQWTLLTSDLSLSVQQEETILITEGKAEILTKSP